MIKHDNPRPSIMEYIVGELKSNPQLSFADLRSRAQLNQMIVQPIQYGRAKALLGLTGKGQPTPAAREAVAAADPDPAPPAPEANGDDEALPGKKGRPFGRATAFVLDYLRMNPEAANKEILARAELEKLEVSPNTLSLARKRLGLGTSTTRRQKPAPPPVAPPPARPSRRHHDAGVPIAQLEQLVQTLRDDEDRIARLEQAIRDTIRMLQKALDG